MSKFGHRKSRNYGFGKNINYAGFNALRESYNSGHFGTIHSHAKRWGQFCVWLKANSSIRDAKNISIDVVESYGRYISERIINHELSVSYGQNLLSSINIVLEIFREDQLIKISPSQMLGNRDNVRTETPLAINHTIVNKTLDQLRQSGNLIPAAILSSARYFGLREREAVLMDYKKAFNEARKTGILRITEGTKGGRGKNIERTVNITLTGLSVLKINAELQGNKKNLIPSNTSWIQLDTQIHNYTVRNIFKNNGLKFYHDARAAWACERYKEITGFDAPAISGKHVYNKIIDQQARQIIASELGHSRKNICVSYIGSAK